MEVIQKVIFLNEEFHVNETPTSYEMLNIQSGDTVTVHKSRCEVKDGFILNKGLKFKIIQKGPKNYNKVIRIWDPYEDQWLTTLDLVNNERYARSDDDEPELEDRYCPRCGVRMTRGSMAWDEGYHFDTCL